MAEAEGVQVRRFWRGLGLPGLVDVHTHFMPERVLRKVWGYFDSLGALTGGVDWPITYRKEEEERVALIREFGVRGFTAMLYPHKPGMAQWLNSWAVDFAGRVPDCLHTSTLFPEPGVETYVREAVDAGARRPDSPRQRLPQHPLSVRPSAVRPGAAGPRGRLAAGGLP